MAPFEVKQGAQRNLVILGTRLAEEWEKRFHVL